MGIERVTTYALFQSTLGNVAKVDAQLATLQNQLSSGLKSWFSRRRSGRMTPRLERRRVSSGR